MKLVTKREPLVAALSAASAVVPLRGPRPSLRNALLTAQKDGAVEVHATDQEVGLRYRLQAESVTEPISLCLPCMTLAGLLKECTEEVVTLETEGAKGILTLGRDRFTVIGQEASEFPEIADIGDAPTVNVPAKDLAGMIDRTVFAAAREQGRYAINGVFVQVKEKLLEVVATDGRRLAYAKRKLKAGGALEEGIIIPAKMMLEIRKLCDQVPENEDAQLALQGRTVLCRGGSMTLSSVLVEGIFPKYQAVIPKDVDREVTFKRDALGLGLRKAMYLTTEETRSVVLTFSPGTCLIEAHSPDKGEAAVTVEAEYTGDKCGIAFNPQFLMDCLRTLTADTVRLELKDKNRPGIVREGTDYLYVLMPVNPNA
jgi:DNA polymerase-3 subunit beta